MPFACCVFDSVLKSFSFTYVFCIEIEFTSFVYGWLVTKDKHDDNGTYVCCFSFIFFLTFFSLHRTEPIERYTLKLLSDANQMQQEQCFWIFFSSLSFALPKHQKKQQKPFHIELQCQKDDISYHVNHLHSLKMHEIGWGWNMRFSSGMR